MLSEHSRDYLGTKIYKGKSITIMQLMTIYWKREKSESTKVKSIVTHWCLRYGPFNQRTHEDRNQKPITYPPLSLCNPKTQCVETMFLPLELILLHSPDTVSRPSLCFLIFCRIAICTKSPIILLHPCHYADQLRFLVWG